jgi:thymidylate synthase (FAD)
MLDMVKKWVPFCYEAFVKHRQLGKDISGPGLEIIKKMLKGKKITQEESGLSKREWGELMSLLEI